ncbi:hypothetical protein DK853_46095, partial [Klebsiella oxytoca]
KKFPEQFLPAAFQFIHIQKIRMGIGYRPDNIRPGKACRIHISVHDGYRSRLKPDIGIAYPAYIRNIPKV